jgi:3-oxoadipate enol-lactonase
VANNIHGPLYYERMGRTGPLVAFIHPNPMDQSCWLYQMAHLSTWYRCLAIDLPGYGRSPKADGGLTFGDLAQACWEAIDETAAGETAILAGCSIGSSIVPHMHHQRPEQTAALILTGTGYVPRREFVQPRIDTYTARGIDYRWDYTFEDFSPAFRKTDLATYFANLFTERNDLADAQTIIRLFEAYLAPDPLDHFQRIACPTVILSGSEDVAHQSAFELQAQIPDCELKVLPDAGHACQMEQPWLFDRLMIEFLDQHGLLPPTR